MDIDRTICVASIPDVGGPYGYVPSLGAGIAFCVVFGLSLILHTYTTIRYRTWWQSIFAVGALAETLGWVGRTWSSGCPYQTTPFLINICALILAPAFFTAGIYIILGRLILTFGKQVSPISPNAYLYIFCTADILSLVIQAIGGGMASVAYQKTPIGDTDLGTRIMVTGVLLQLAAISIFAFLFTWVLYKGFKSSRELLANNKVQLVIAATIFSVICIVIRSIYRTIELLEGWDGYLMTTERFFIGLDGMLMILAVGVFNFIRPGWSEAWKF